MAHQQTDEVINRLSRIEGHVAGVKKMVGDGKPCSDVLIQLAAIKAAVNQVSRVVLEDHIEHCVIDAAESGDAQEVLDDLKKALSTFIRKS